MRVYNTMTFMSTSNSNSVVVQEQTLNIMPAHIHTHTQPKLGSQVPAIVPQSSSNADVCKSVQKQSAYDDRRKA